MLSADLPTTLRATPKDPASATDWALVTTVGTLRDQELMAESKNLGLRGGLENNLAGIEFPPRHLHYLAGTSSFFSKLRKLALSMQTCSMMSHFGFN